MRNFSMKKFGTPMRAGPGLATEIVGFSSDGEPSVLTVGFVGSGVLVRSTFPTRVSPLASTAWLPVAGGLRPPAPGVLTGAGEDEPPEDGRSEPGAGVDGAGADGVPGVGSGRPGVATGRPGLGVGVGVRVGVGVGVRVGVGIGVRVGVGVGARVGVGVGVGVSTGPRSVTLCTGAG